MILSYITDAREAYARTIYEKIAGSKGFTISLRYDTKWVEPSLVKNVDDSLKNNFILMCFLEGNDGTIHTLNALACRYAKIIKCEVVSNSLNITAELLGFPSSAKLKALTADCDERGLCKPGPKDGYFVVESRSPTWESTNDYKPESWMKIVEKLACTKYFAQSSFIYVEKVCAESNKTTITTDGNSFELMSGNKFKIYYHLYGKSVESRLHRYTFQLEGDGIRALTKDDFNTEWGIGGGEFKFLVTSPPAGNNIAYSKITLKPTGSEAKGFEILFHIASIQPLWAKVERVLFVAISAGGATAAGVLPATVPVFIKLSLIFLGALGLGLASLKK